MLVLAVTSLSTILIAGILTFTCGGNINKRNSLKLMNLRVATQAFVLLLLASLFSLG